MGLASSIAPRLSQAGALALLSQPPRGGAFLGPRLLGLGCGGACSHGAGADRRGASGYGAATRLKITIARPSIFHSRPPQLEPPSAVYSSRVRTVTGVRP
jgi:hypothetical protein